VKALLGAGGMFFRNGSGALMLAYVAAGRLAGYFETVMYPWDCRAALLMIREAGGRTAPFGDPQDLVRDGPVLAAAPGAWDDLERLFGAEVRRLSPTPPAERAASGAG
jgi:myo-inositol-1(or 4)-monophosphatase